MSHHHIPMHSPGKKELQAENRKKIAAVAAAAACLVECRIGKKVLYLLSRLYVLVDAVVILEKYIEPR